MKFVFLILFAVIAFCFANTQNAHAKGFVTCRGKPYPGAGVGLRAISNTGDDYEWAEGQGQVSSGADGHFEISGLSSKWDNPNFNITFQHNCQVDPNDTMNCGLLMEVRIPSNSNGQLYDAGEIKLETLDVITWMCGGAQPSQ